MTSFTGTLHVPGKLMLAGEYSVLGPSGMAIAVAVRPGLSLRVEDADAWRIEREDLGMVWRRGGGAPPEALAFAAAALERAIRYAGCDGPPAALMFEPLEAFGSGKTKPGVGGSASATVVTMAAACRRLGARIDPGHLASLSIAVHRDVQGGRGSGYDIATIAHGGLVEYRPVQLAGVGGEVQVDSTRISWPSGLRLIAGYSGQSASTTALLKRLEARAAEDRVGTARALAALAAPVPELADALRAGDFGGIRSAVEACQGALEAFDNSCGLGIMTDSVRRLIDLASDLGAASKVSGAGGGDSVVALAVDDAVVESVRAAWESNGFQVLAVDVSLDESVADSPRKKLQVGR